MTIISYRKTKEDHKDELVVKCCLGDDGEGEGVMIQMNEGSRETHSWCRALL